MKSIRKSQIKIIAHTLDVFTYTVGKTRSPIILSFETLQNIIRALHGVEITPKDIRYERQTT